MTAFWCYLLAAAVVGIDQLTKWLAVQNLTKVDTVPLWDGVLHLTYVENTGAAFGMMKDSRWVFMIASTVAIVILTAAIAKYAKDYTFACICLAMILGGGIGNMIDRVVMGHVVDFIDFRLINFAVFNGADSFVCIGAALFMLYLVWGIILDSKAAKAVSETPDGGSEKESGNTADGSDKIGENDETD